MSSVKKKLLCFMDTETTGYSAKCGLIEVAMLFTDLFGNSVSVAGDNLHVFKIAPLITDEVYAQALEVNGYTKPQIFGFPHARIQLAKMLDLLLKVEEEWEFVIAGYNFAFDVRTLVAFYDKVIHMLVPTVPQLHISKKLFNKNIDYIEVYDCVKFALARNATMKSLNDGKTTCKLSKAYHLFVPIKSDGLVAHQAGSDVIMTKDLFFSFDVDTRKRMSKQYSQLLESL